ncbi:MAG: hypothetical protein ABL995_19765 [Bryobacteraceae bacterium]
MRRALVAALLSPVLGVCQSVYSLEVLPSGHFEPSEKYTAITGLHIDAHGNIAGVASKIAPELAPEIAPELAAEIAAGKIKTTGFLWRASADPVRALAWGEGASASPCTPRGMDAAGNVYLYCGAGARNVLFSPESNSYREARTGELETLRSAGSWSAGASIRNEEVRAMRAATNGPPQTLLPGKNHRDSSALAVNSNGDAAGVSGILVGAIDGSGKSIVSGLAAYWPQGKEEPQLISAPPDSSWTAQVARAVNDGGVIAGSTSPSVAPMPACPGAGSAPQLTRAFVAVAGKDAPTAELLPSIAGDTASTIITPTSINTIPQIVGYREMFECAEGTPVKDRRAVRWRKENNAWIAEVIDRLPVSLTAVCFRDLVLTEANSVNENGQLTGSGTCVDQSDQHITFAYRLTPIGPEELPLR